MATILVVDDRQSNRQFLTTLLGYCGHQLTEAANGAEALEHVRAERPQLVITDILMPTMDGFEFVQRLRADPDLAPTPVLFYTATYSEPQARALASSCGVRAVLPKPCEPQRILDAVNEALGLDAGSTPLPAQDDGSRRVVVENVAPLLPEVSRLSAVIELGMEAMQERDPARLVKLFFGTACEMMNAEYAALGILGDDGQTLGHLLTKKLDPALYRAETGVDAGLLDPLLSRRGALRTSGAGAKLGGRGFPKGHPVVQSVLAVTISTRDTVYGWLYFAERRGAQEFSAEDERLALVLARQLALLYESSVHYDLIQRHAAALQIEALERRRAEQKSRDYAAQLQGLSRRLVEVEETERRSINRELHDRVGQNLAALNINLNIVRSRIPQPSLGTVSERLDDTQRLLEETSGHIRNVMADLHPPALDEYGLRAALRTYAETFRARVATPVVVQGEDLAPRLPLAAETALFRVAQGALANAIAHAGATRIEITLAARADRVTLTIADDGAGFDTAHPRPGRASWGLAIMRERAEAVGATLRIDSAPARGTRVVVEMARNPA